MRARNITHDPKQPTEANVGKMSRPPEKKGKMSARDEAGSTVWDQPSNEVVGRGPEVAQGVLEGRTG